MDAHRTVAIDTSLCRSRLADRWGACRPQSGGQHRVDRGRRPGCPAPLLGINRHHHVLRLSNAIRPCATTPSPALPSCSASSRRQMQACAEHEVAPSSATSCTRTENTCQPGVPRRGPTVREVCAGSPGPSPEVGAVDVTVVGRLGDHSNAQCATASFDLWSPRVCGNA
jgi:hypothetical protein